MGLVVFFPVCYLATGIRYRPAIDCRCPSSPNPLSTAVLAPPTLALPLPPPSSLHCTSRVLTSLLVPGVLVGLPLLSNILCTVVYAVPNSRAFILTNYDLQFCLPNIGVDCNCVLEFWMFIIIKAHYYSSSSLMSAFTAYDLYRFSWMSNTL